MENSRPSGLWLQADGCCNGPSWVVAEFSTTGSLFLTRGWKLFARSRSLAPRQLLHFKLIGVDTLTVRFFGATGVRLECCAESSSDIDFDSSSDSDDEDGTDENDAFA